MANEQDQKQNPATGTEADISKAQSAQQPPEQASKRQPESAEQGQFETGEQNETLARKETDVEGSSLRSPERGEAESGFVGAEGRRDTSSELVEGEESEEGRKAPDAE